MLGLQVVFMQELALVTLLAQASQPMLTHKIIEGMSDLVFIRAVIT